MKGIKCLFIIASFIPNQVYSQGKINLLGGMDFSENWFWYAQQGKVLRYSEANDDFFISNFHGGIQYKPIQSFSVELGIQQIQIANMCVDTAYLTRHPENRNAFLNLPGTFSSLTSLGIIKSYTSYYATATKYFPLGDVFSYYVSFGFSWNQLQSRSSPSGINTFYDSTNNETLQLSYSCINHYFGVVTETGMSMIFFKGRASLSCGFRGNTGFKTVLVGNYTDIQNNTLINTDHFSSRGEYLGVVSRISINLFSSDKLNPKITKPRISLTHNKSDKTKYPKKINEQDKEERIGNKKHKSSSIPIDPLPKKLKNREVKIKKELITNNRIVTIRVWDYDKIDGDIISLYLNGELILGKYTLTKERYEIKIELKPGINYLVLHSISMGKEVPCTAAMIIDDGRNQQEVILYSSPQSSDGIKIKLDD